MPGRERKEEHKSDCRILRCPNCYVGAVWAEVTLTLDSEVECSNCHETFKLEELLKNDHKKTK
jgi:uncharacterized protein (DUF983 family)